MSQQIFTVSGITCGNCVKKITDALHTDAQLKNLRVTLSPPQIQFEASEKISARALNDKLSPLSKYSVVEASQVAAVERSVTAFLLKYLPLLLLFGLSAGIPAINLALGRSDFEHWMFQFMGATLVGLSYFKLTGLPKFAEAFSTYDPIAMKFYSYGYLYPFFELVTGIGLLLAIETKALSVFMILFLLPTTIGVIQALRQKRVFQCACLGTAFNLPLTKVTIVENVLMIAMAIMILF